MELSKENVKHGLTSDAIKIIAIIAMTIDHIAWAFFPHFSIELPILFGSSGNIVEF